MKKIAFTLAEILIVLGLIGIVAESTIPTLVNDFQKQVQVTQLKKFYTNFEQGMRAYMASQGCTDDLACTGLFASSSPETTWQDRMNTELPKIFRVDKIYGEQNSELSLFKTTYLDNSGTSALFYLSSFYSFTTLDNFLIGMGDGGGNCTRYPTYESKLKNACGLLYVDINGFQKPNKLGRDVFNFVLANNGMLYPRDGIENSLARNNNLSYYWKNLPAEGCGIPDNPVIPTGYKGYGCAARIIDNGWKMDY